ncbi:MAG TPA: ROK family protein [Terriglobia bacterium]|nr:ROK family protein [Terriglobia bacterium]
MLREEKIIGAVDIGGTKIAAGAVTRQGKIITRLECATAPEEGFGLAMQRTKSMLREAAARACAEFEGIGVACPGPLDPYTGIVGEVGTLPGWQGGNLVAELAPEFGVPVAVENDADAVALAEVHWGAAKGSEHFIYITVSTGIGGGIILSGKLYRGAHGAHPELGHQVIDASGPLCYCHAHGCWESLASGSAMASWTHEQQPAAPDAPELTAAQICALAEQGDPLAWRSVEREGYYLGLGLANLITMFAPETIALGGGVMKSHHLFFDRAREVIREVCTQVPDAKTQITLASLGADTGLAGAAQAWLCRYP